MRPRNMEYYDYTPLECNILWARDRMCKRMHSFQRKQTYKDTNSHYPTTTIQFILSKLDYFCQIVRLHNQ